MCVRKAHRTQNEGKLQIITRNFDSGAEKEKREEFNIINHELKLKAHNQRGLSAATMLLNIDSTVLRHRSAVVEMYQFQTSVILIVSLMT